MIQRLPLHRFPFDSEAIPRNGIYVLFEKGETAHGANRIIRVGTHRGDDQLRSRLAQHLMWEKKDRSIFRKNIGRALLNRDGDPFLEQWELDLTTRKAREQYGNLIDTRKQAETERQVTEYLQGNISFVVFRVDNRDERLVWESKIISTVAQCQECKPSTTWLGRHSPKQKIRESGLWLVNELEGQPISQSELELLEEMVIASR